MTELKKETVLMVHNYYQIPGGEDTVVANEKKMLEDHGHKVVLYTRHNNELKNLSLFGKFLLIFRTIFNWPTYIDIRRIIREENIDIVHVHNTLPLISPAVYYAAISMKKPVIQTVHNFRLLCPAATFYRDGHICEECVEKGLLNSVKHGCYRGSKMQSLFCVILLYSQRLLGLFNKINFLFLTEFTKEKFISTGMIAEHQAYIKPNTCSDCGGRKNGQRDYFLFVGRLEENKGIRVLLKAFAAMPEQRLLIAGNGTLYQEADEFIKDHKLKNISLLGQVEAGRLPQYIQHAKALIMCSQWYETFGMVVIEAYSNGVPVIVGDMGNSKDLVINGLTGLTFLYNSSEALKEAINKLDEKDIDHMGENAYQVFLKNYHMKCNYSKLKDIYTSITLYS